MALDPSLYLRAQALKNNDPFGGIGNAISNGLYQRKRNEQIAEQQALERLAQARAKEKFDLQMDQLRRQEADAQDQTRQTQGMNALASKLASREELPGTVGPMPGGGMPTSRQDAAMSLSNDMGLGKAGVDYVSGLDEFQPVDPYKDIADSGFKTYLAATGEMPSNESYTEYKRQELQGKKEVAKESAPKTSTFITNEEGLNKFSEALATSNAKLYEEIVQKGMLASEQKDGIKLQRATIEQGLDTGKFAPLLNAVGGYLEGFGLDPKSFNLPDPTKGQIFDMATFKNLLDALAQQKGPQTEGDAERALKTFASLSNTKDANMFILDYLEARANRQEELASYINTQVNSNPSLGNNVNAINNLVHNFNMELKNIPIVGKSSTTGLPMTYYKYKQAAMANGMTDIKEINSNWRKFAKD